MRGIDFGSHSTIFQQFWLTCLVNLSASVASFRLQTCQAPANNRMSLRFCMHLIFPRPGAGILPQATEIPSGRPQGLKFPIFFDFWSLWSQIFRIFWRPFSIDFSHRFLIDFWRDLKLSLKLCLIIFASFWHHFFELEFRSDF